MTSFIRATIHKPSRLMRILEPRIILHPASGDTGRRARGTVHQPI
jgi:hypothetical protein